MKEAGTFTNTPLISELVHKVRTPLSVISNDLNYLKELNRTEEYDRALRKIYEIDQLLNEFNELASETRAKS